ncbi:lipocalin family protein [Telluribacter sp. SYSU D00476]|uniref:lipocalin family protein n=1 Tax=Telluribacter sp. SYSU D00476 TaxID=2811430 RepID=UPI001FF4E961|nr:lipocalin family protein [Telluribacter sp. SYSU D00476]
MNKRKLLVGGALLGVVALAMLNSCRTIPKGVTAVQPFDVNRYLGKWYEVARFDYRFERNLNNVTAQYSLNPDGTIKVENRGYNFKEQEWKGTTGKAKFVEDESTGKLKVSFFGPFYSGYNVVEIDPEYRYALVAGKDLDYLWLLSRETTMPEAIKQRYLEKARSIGYDTSKLIWVEHPQ